LWFLSAGYT